MILRFEGGPLDGLEEDGAATPPVMFRMPPLSEMVYAGETGVEGARPPSFGAMYQLMHLDVERGVAMYQVVDD